jgi:hypothetical protein
MQRIDPIPHPWRKLKDPINLADESNLESLEHRIPNQGDQKLLAILADFPDQPGRFSGQAWWEFFFGQNGFSDYYREVSHNQLRYVADIVGISGNTYVKNDDRVAYVRLPRSVSYYANKTAGRGDRFQMLPVWFMKSFIF